MRLCSVCGIAITRGGGPGPRSHPVLCSAHYFRFLRGSKAWKDPAIRGAGVELARIRISEKAKRHIDKAFAVAKKKRPALAFHEFFDGLYIYDEDGEPIIELDQQ